MDQKFLKLKKEYKNFIKTNIEQIKKLDIETNLTKEKCKLIYKLYNKIYKSIENSEVLNVNDINHIIINYSKEDPNVELFKKFIKIKNLYLIKKVIQSNLWEPFILKLNSEINPNKQIKHLLSKGVYKLLINSVNQFRGCWEIAEFTNDKVKKIDIVEPDHIEFLKKYIKNK